MGSAAPVAPLVLTERRMEGALTHMPHRNKLVSTNAPRPPLRSRRRSWRREERVLERVERVERETGRQVEKERRGRQSEQTTTTTTTTNL